MTPEQIEQAVRDAMATGISFNWSMYVAIAAFTLLSGYLGAYFKRRGENFATKQDFEMLLAQTTQTAQATEEIRGKVSQGLWLSQAEFEYRKQQLAEFYGPIYAYLRTDQELYHLWIGGKIYGINLQILDMFRGLDHGIGHFRVAAEDSEARAATPPIPKSTQTSTVASDRKIAPRPSSRQAA
jgi:hypothetical protein